MSSEENGFTLIELVIVIVILGIVVTSVSAYFAGMQEKINASACKANQLSLIQAQKLHYTHYYFNESDGRYAEELEELIPFIQHESIPICPSQGSYLIEEDGGITCSIPGHKRIN